MPSATEISTPRHPSSSEAPEIPPDLSKHIPKLEPRRRPVKSAKRQQAEDRKDEQSIPETPPLEAIPQKSTLCFAHPLRKILSAADHDAFLSSSTYTLVTAFIFEIADSVRGRKISSVTHEELPSPVLGCLQLLDRCEDLVEQCPPLDNGSRFGNPAFRDYIKQLASPNTSDKPDGEDHGPTVSLLASWIAVEVLPSNPSWDMGPLLDELTTYLLSSFGSPTRIDYGSGHELHFFVFLLCLNRLNLITESTFPALALRVLPKYLSLQRKLQSTYYLEPAGSHGVWGLDDYHFLPFLFGSAQLLDHPYIRPLGIHNQLTIEEEADEFLYLDMVRELERSKTVKGLRWHSPMLDDISSAKSWSKIHGGMRKMFLNEVLGKLPVVQHLLFGGLVQAPPAIAGEGRAGDVDTFLRGGAGSGDDNRPQYHKHNPEGWSDCCGIQVPSSIGAVQEMRKRMGGDGGLREVPFD